MSLFDVFRHSKPAQPETPAQAEPPKGRESLLAAVRKGGVTPQKCGVCGESYDHPNQTPLLVIELDDWEPDLGGYCSHCRQHLCPKHVRLATSGTVEILGSKHDAYARQCVTCQTTLTDKEGDDPNAPPASVLVRGIRVQ